MNRLRNYGVGDIVELTKKTLGAQPGATATVTDIDYEGGWLGVEWHRDNPLCNNQMDGHYYPNSFKKVNTDMKIVKLKPIKSIAEIKGGNWTHVVIDDEGFAVAMFPEETEAQEYADYHDGYTIREVDNG